jgi:hypothetical protein
LAPVVSTFTIEAEFGSIAGEPGIGEFHGLVAAYGRCVSTVADALRVTTAPK